MRTYSTPPLIPHHPRHPRCPRRPRHCRRRRCRRRRRYYLDYRLLMTLFCQQIVG